MNERSEIGEYSQAELYEKKRFYKMKYKLIIGKNLAIRRNFS